ncbi:hypothetical protein QTP88_025334 [Uroleucon formosanum]
MNHLKCAYNDVTLTSGCCNDFTDECAHIPTASFRRRPRITTAGASENIKRIVGSSTGGLISVVDERASTPHVRFSLWRLFDGGSVVSGRSTCVKCGSKTLNRQNPLESTWQSSHAVLQRPLR